MSSTLPPAASTSCWMWAKTLATCVSRLGGSSRVPGLVPPITLDMMRFPILLAFGIGFSWRGLRPLMLWRFGTATSLTGRRRGTKDRYLDAVDQGVRPIRRQQLRIVQGRVQIPFPHLARQVVEQFDAVTIGIVDIKTVSHAMFDSSIELDAFCLQIIQLAQPCVPARIRDGNVVDSRGHSKHLPICRRRGKVWVFHQSEFVVVHAVFAFPAVEPHLGWIWTAGCFLELADLLEPDHLGPKTMGLFNIPHVEYKMIDSAWRDRFIGHRFPPV